MVDRKEISASAGRLRRRLEVLQDHQRAVWLGEGLGLLFAVLLVALGAVMVLDNLAHLHVALRIPLLAALAGAAVLLVRRLARLLREPLTAERMAVKVEQKFPQVDNRMINALLLAGEDDPEASELIHCVVEEGNADAAKLSLTSAIPKRKMGIMLASAAAAVALMGAYAVVYPNHFVNALSRVLMPFGGVRPLTATKILAVSPKSQNILAGDKVTIVVQLEGKIPDSAEVVFTPEGDEKQVAVMRPGEKPKEFRCLMADVSRSFTYGITAGDAASDSYRITVHHRPAVTAMKLEVTPPDYTGLAPASQESGTVRALAGSRVALRATCSKPIAKAALALSSAQAPIPMQLEGDRTIVASFPVNAQATYHINLTDTAGFDSKPVDHQVEMLADDPPELTLDAPPPAVVVKPEATVPFKITATDRYGVQNIELLQVVKEADGKSSETSLETWKADSKTQKVLTATHQLPVARLGIAPGQSGTVKVVARDWNNVTGPGVSHPAQVVITVLSSQEAKDKSREALKLVALELAQIIQKQQRNIAAGERLRTHELREAGSLAKSADDLKASIALQEDVRTSSGKLLEIMDERVPIRGVVKLLYNDEMVTAVKQLRAVADAPKQATALQFALATERVILVRLSGRSDQLQRQMEMAGLQDIFAALDELIRLEKKIRTDTEAAAAEGGGPAKDLAARQDKLALKLVQFKEQLAAHARAIAQTDADQAKRFDQAGAMIDSRQIRQNMLLAAAKLDKGELSPAMPIEDKILADLKAIGDFLREPLIASAAKKLEELKQLMADSKDKSEKLAKLQAAIKEISEELERSKDNRGDEAKELAQKAAELEGIKEKIQDVVEQMAKDLALFPEVPSCNELVKEMREVFEDVEQQAGSESTPAEEVAVDRDEGMLEGLDKVKERIADMEEWLMDKPDNIKWKQESWDKNEMPNIPLVDLPEELEDLVGDLVDKEEEVDEEAQDSASNAATADIPAGWDVADGPISNWSAKGKSGNEKPNANEMAGRSGSGREGNANGELVEGKAKDLEGRETKARRTHDPFGEGQIEEENPESKANATGGGKQSGIGGEGGMRGSAPARNELAMRELERRQRDLRRDTESVYSKASLMYLPTGELDEAILLMQKAEDQARGGDYAGFSETQRRVVRALQNTKSLLAGGPSRDLELRHKLPESLREEVFDARDEPIPPEFEKLVSEYYKAIAAGIAK